MSLSIVYFSSVSENTHRFVEKLRVPAPGALASGPNLVPARRIPVHRESSLTVDEPYVLITPTYGGGRSETAVGGGYVPKQVIRFLNDPHNRSLIRGVIAAGNTNFGEEYGMAGELIAAKCRVPYLYRFELRGTADDVERVRVGLAEFACSTERTLPCSTEQLLAT